MSELEINEDNCVLSNNDLRVIVRAFESYVDLICESSCGRSEEVATQEGERLYQKIYKLNEMAKHEMLMEDSRKNDTDMATLLS